MASRVVTQDDRAERHLSRMRGAGVRAITANFDFVFTSFATPQAKPLIKCAINDRQFPHSALSTEVAPADDHSVPKTTAVKSKPIVRKERRPVKSRAKAKPKQARASGEPGAPDVIIDHTQVQADGSVVEDLIKKVATKEESHERQRKRRKVQPNPSSQDIAIEEDAIDRTVQNIEAKPIATDTQGTAIQRANKRLRAKATKTRCRVDTIPEEVDLEKRTKAVAGAARQPLAVADPNKTSRPTSPVKIEHFPEKHFKPRRRAELEESIPVINVTEQSIGATVVQDLSNGAPPSSAKKRRFMLFSDESPTIKKHPKTTTQSPVAAKGKAKAIQMSLKLQTSSNAPPGSVGGQNKAHKPDTCGGGIGTKQSRTKRTVESGMRTSLGQDAVMHRQSKPANGQFASACKGDQEIDWLLDGQAPLRKTTLGISAGRGKASSSGRRVLHARLPEMDLDDMLSGIALLAKERAAITSVPVSGR